MTVADNTVLRAVFELLFPDYRVAQMVFHFLSDFTSPQSDAAVEAAIESYVDDVVTEVDDDIKSTCTVAPGDVNEMEWNAGEGLWEVARFVGVIEPSITFAETTEMLPHAVCPVLVANTARPKTRGRKSIPGFCEADNDMGDVSAAALSHLATALAVYLADETISAGNDLIVGVASTITGSFWPFSDGHVDGLFGSQRRRKAGVGI